MNGTIYVQKEDAHGVLMAGWVSSSSKKPPYKPLGPEEDELSEDLDDALIFDLNNHVGVINAYLDAGYSVRTANNLIYRPTGKKPNSMSIA